MRRWLSVVSFCALAIPIWTAADDLVSRTIPADLDRSTFQPPITIHFSAPIELDSNGNGRFTPVRSASIEAGDPDIIMGVNDPGQRNRVRFERDSDNDPSTPGGIAVPATAIWELSDFPPLLRIVPAQPLERDAVYRVIVFEDADPLNPCVRRISDRAGAAPHAFTFRTLSAGLHGTVQHIQFLPPSLGFKEDYNVYLPPGNESAAAQRYPVLYLLHGGFDDYTGWNKGSFTETDGGRAAEIADRLIDDGIIEPLILVMPDGNEGKKCFVMQWHHLFSNAWNGTFRYGDYATTDLPNDVDARFKTQTDRSGRGVAGLSMGGFGTASVGWGHISRFSFVAPLSAWEYSAAMTTAPAFPTCNATHWSVIPDFGACGGEMLQAVIGPAGSSDLTHMQTVNGRDLAMALKDADFRGAIFIGHGVADTSATVSWSDDVSCALAQAGAAHCYKRPIAEGHTWSYWNQALELEILPRFHAKTGFAALPLGIDADCVNPYVQPLADTDGDSLYDDGDQSGTPGDHPCTVPGASCDDNCRDFPNLDQLDSDHDGRGDLCDCAPSDPTVFAVPSEVGNLKIATDCETISWSSAAAHSGTSTLYDLSRGSLWHLPVGGAGAPETCIESKTPIPKAVDPAIPTPGDGFWYLVRGRNSCGLGTYGEESAGPERLTAVCQ